MQLGKLIIRNLYNIYNRTKFVADPITETLLIFIKNPERGRVKTRLARTAGDDTALAVYRELLKVTKSITDPLNVNREVWYSRFIDQEDMWAGGEYSKKLQRGKALGSRMKVAFRQAFGNGCSKVVIIGSDCAELTSSLLRRAFCLLDRYEAVVGPSRDGGYYLLGMREYHPVLFDQKKWGSSTVCRQTLHQLQKMKISYKLMRELNDIDTEQDLNQSRHLSAL